MARRVECVGYGRPCPAHAWWWHDAAHRPRKRCDLCAERVRWLEPEHATTCSECGAPLDMAATGRPRVVCSEECAATRRRNRRAEPAWKPQLVFPAARSSDRAKAPPPSARSAGSVGVGGAGRETT